NYGLRRLISLLILIVIFTFFLAPLLSVAVDAGVFQNLYLDAIEEFPFGNGIAEFSVKALSAATSLDIDVNQYVIHSATRKTVLELIQEFCKACLSAIVFAALVKAGDTLMGIDKIKSIWDFFTKALWHMIAAILCSMVVALLISFAFTKIQSLGVIAGNILTFVISAASIGMSGWIFAAFFGAGVGLTILYVLVGVILYNLVNLLVTEMAISCLIIAVNEKLYLRAVACFSAWIVIIIILAGVGMMIDSVTK
ncbi:MAG: hypothetical protein LUH07_09805, partial [Lachnospiraceae bacterium]|nr:hypothetical protein [Lachnospiraceae bacterium]